MSPAHGRQAGGAGGGNHKRGAAGCIGLLPGRHLREPGPGWIYPRGRLPPTFPRTGQLDTLINMQEIFTIATDAREGLYDITSGGGNRRVVRDGGRHLLLICPRCNGSGHDPGKLGRERAERCSEAAAAGTFGAAAGPVEGHVTNPWGQRVIGAVLPEDLYL